MIECRDFFSSLANFHSFFHPSLSPTLWMAIEDNAAAPCLRLPGKKLSFSYSLAERWKRGESAYNWLTGMHAFEASVNWGKKRKSSRVVKSIFFSFIDWGTTFTLCHTVWPLSNPSVTFTCEAKEAKHTNWSLLKLQNRIAVFEAARRHGWLHVQAEIPSVNVSCCNECLRLVHSLHYH